MQEGWNYSTALFNGSDTTPIAFTGPDDEDWYFYEYEQIFRENDPELEAYCDSLTDEIDLSQYRKECWVNSTFDFDSEFCAQTLEALEER